MTKMTGKVREQWGRMEVHRDPERHHGTGPESGQSPKGALKRMKATPEGNAEPNQILAEGFR